MAPRFHDVAERPPRDQQLREAMHVRVGDNGAGLGASHQTGWTGLVAGLLDLFGRLDAKALLDTDRDLLRTRLFTEQVTGQKET
jgi:hypothetical protein